METIPTAWETFLEQIRRPHRLLQGVVEYFSGWFVTRRWFSLVLFSPVLLIVLAAVGLSAYGNWKDQGQLVEAYLDLAEDEINSDGEPGTDEDDPDPESTALTLMEEESITKYGELLLRRVLQLEKSNNRATYLVAAQIGRSGRMGQARRMMRSLAPEQGKGFPPAHAWLAIDRMRLGITTREQRDILASDLAEATSWSGAGGGLIAAYADVLESQGRVGDAIRVLEEATRGDSSIGAESLELKLANLAHKHGRDKPLNDIAEQRKLRIEERMRKGEATTEDFVALSNLFLLESLPDKALQAAEMGLKETPDEKRLRRLASESFRVKYLQQLYESRGQRVGLGLLDAALKADPTNPAIGQEVARLIAMGREASEKLNRVLEEQIKQGTTTTLTHILLADREIRSGALEKAIAHLEIALRQAKGNPTVLNNLGLALALKDPPDLERARTLVDQAVAAVPSNAEYLDSQGEIRMLSDDPHGAIDSFEKAIGLASERINTREKLAAAYQAVGLPEMAALQEQEIARLQEEALEQQSENPSVDSTDEQR